MSHDTKKITGFTLVELLVAIGIIGIISVISTQLLWDSVTTRSKQGTIGVYSENLRNFIKNLTNSVQEATYINVPNSTTIEIKGKICKIIKYDLTDKNIVEADDNITNCKPTDFHPVIEQVIGQEIKISSFEFSPTGSQPSTVTITITGGYKDLTGDHPNTINFNTTITPRVTI